MMSELGVLSTVISTRAVLISYCTCVHVSLPWSGQHRLPAAIFPGVSICVNRWSEHGLAFFNVMSVVVNNIVCLCLCV